MQMYLRNSIKHKLFLLAILLSLSNLSNVSFAYIYQSYTVGSFSIKAEITPDSCYSSGKGMIGLYVTGGTSPYAYLWNNGATTSVISSLTSGTYSVTVTDAVGNNATVSIQLTNQILWTDITGLSLSRGVLTKTDTSIWGNAGAASLNILNENEDGFVAFSVTTLNADVYSIGLSTSNENNHYNTTDYCFMYNNQKVSIYENGVKVAVCTVKVGNTFKVLREGSNIKYYRNATLLRTVATNANSSLFADVAIKNTGNTISNIASSFCVPVATNFIDTAYAILKTQLDGGYYIAQDGLLAFTYFEEYNDVDGLLNYTIYDEKRKIVASASTHPLAVMYGENKYNINMPNDLLIASKKHYTLEVINEKKEKWLLRFYNDVECGNCQ